MKAKPIVRRAGGKSRLLKYVLPMVPDTKCYVEVFGGGAALLLAREPKGVEVYNDIDGALVNLFRQAKYHPEELCRELEMMPASRELFEERKADLGITEIQRAASYLYLNKCSFGGLNRDFGTGTLGGGVNSSKMRWAESIRAFAARFDKVTIESESWEDLVKRYDRPHTFFFFDPPYVSSSKNIGYLPWSAEEMGRFEKGLRPIKGKWLLTVCDSPECREIFSRYEIKEVSRQNSIENRSGLKKNKQYKELIITKGGADE